MDKRNELVKYIKELYIFISLCIITIMAFIWIGTIDIMQFLKGVYDDSTIIELCITIPMFLFLNACVLVRNYNNLIKLKDELKTLK